MIAENCEVRELINLHCGVLNGTESQFRSRTRMHSSRMRTGRSVTVSGEGGASQKKFLGKKFELKKI